MKIKNILTILLIGIFLISSASALETMKPATLNEEYIIEQTCASCSYVNVTVSNTNGIIFYNAEMANNGSGVWMYNFTPTQVGRHDAKGIGDINGEGTSFASSFQVEAGGLTGTLGFYFIILILSAGAILLGFYINDPWVVILGGFGLIFVGIFTMFNGIDGIRDPVYTWGLGIITLMLGCYFSIRASIESMFS
jgi:hypothetical protein